MRTLLTNGFIHTPSDPGATALLVEGDRIAWIGHEGAALAQADGVDRVIDLQGSLVTPAFVDAHVHVTATGMQQEGLQLNDCSSRDDVLSRLMEHCRSLQPGQVAMGHGWDETGWPDQRLPSRAEIDAAVPGVPVHLVRVDTHSAIVSTALLDRIGGITDLDGYHPSGVLRSAAHHLALTTLVDRIPPTQREALQRRALADFAAAGIAAVHEMAGPDISTRDDAAALMDLGAHEDNPAVTLYWGELGGVQTALELGAIGAGGDLLADGALGSRTAHLCQPYTDVPGHYGLEHLTWQQIRDHTLECAAAGLQSGFHTIGDAAIAAALRGLAAAADEVGVSTLRRARNRLEHVEMPDAAAIGQFRTLGITASVQPVFDAEWGGPDGMYAERLGADRVRGMNPFAAFQSAGVVMAFASDAPVTPIDPWGAVAAAVHHQQPDSAISARAAFNAHTRGGWRAVGVDDAGILQPGFAAHLAVWECDELAVQTPDHRIVQWSTDPRSGTPVLPVVGAGMPRPRNRLTMRSGRIIHSCGHLT